MKLLLKIFSILLFCLPAVSAYANLCSYTPGPASGQTQTQSAGYISCGGTAGTMVGPVTVTAGSTCVWINCSKSATTGSTMSTIGGTGNSSTATCYLAPAAEYAVTTCDLGNGNAGLTVTYP